MTQSNLDSRARKRIAQLAREGGTSRSILARLQAEGVHTSLAAVARVLAASPAPSGGSVRRRTPRKPSTGPAGARTAASVLADPSAVPNFLDRRIVKLMARAEEISESGTLGAEVKVLAAIATVAERSRALRPPGRACEGTRAARRAGRGRAARRSGVPVTGAAFASEKGEAA
jgi:hypothetical protein